MRSHFLEGRRWLEAVLHRDCRTDTAARAKALTEAGTCAWHQADYEQATIFHTEALELYQELGDERGVAFALICLGCQDVEQGDYERAEPTFEKALSLCRKLGDKVTTAYALSNLGEVARHRGEYERGRALVTESLCVFKELDDIWGIALCSSWLGMVAAYNNDQETAAKFLREGLSIAQELESGEPLARCLEGLASMAGTKAEGVRAARLYGAAKALRSAIGAPLPPVDRTDYERHLAAARGKLDENSWEMAWAEGQAMAFEQAIEYALSEDKTVPSAVPLSKGGLPGSSTMGKLSRREMELAALVARGLKNRQIAQELVLSERTIENHVRNILKKLNLSSRSEIAAWVEGQRAQELSLG
jgi:DNA-binding CsgD family transcriptional regulator/tetratricopeptide (TPR) repeat protein